MFVFTCKNIRQSTPSPFSSDIMKISCRSQGFYSPQALFLVLITMLSKAWERIISARCKNSSHSIQEDGIFHTCEFFMHLIMNTVWHLNKAFSQKLV